MRPVCQPHGEPVCQPHGETDQWAPLTRGPHLSVDPINGQCVDLVNTDVSRLDPLGDVVMTLGCHVAQPGAATCHPVVFFDNPLLIP